jgi:hypothetical protein
MKRSFIIFVFVAFLSLQAQAQFFTIGPKFGVSQGDISVASGFRGEDSKIGYHVGAFTRFNLPIIYIQPEILYTNTGGSFSDNTFNYDVNFNRLDVPLLIGLKLGSILSLQAGPVATYLLNGELNSHDGNTSTRVVPPKEDFTFGYQAGVALDIGNFLIGVKYEGGMTNSINRNISVPTDQRQNQLILSMGFRLF